MATTKEATPNSSAAVRDLDWMLVMGSLLCAKSAPTTSAPFSAPRLCASTRKVSHNEKLESDAFQAPREITPPTAEGSWVTAEWINAPQVYMIRCFIKRTAAGGVGFRAVGVRSLAGL